MSAMQQSPASPSPPQPPTASGVVLNPVNKRTGPLSRASAAYPRKRAVAACQVCRLRKTKCDQKKPVCSFCASIGAECNSDAASLSSFDPASIEIIERLEKLQGTLDSFTRLAPVPPSPNGDDQHLPAPGPIPVNRPRLGPVSASVSHEQPPGDFLLVNLASVLKWPVFQHFSLPAVNLPTSSQYSPASQNSSLQGPSISISDELQPAACNQWLDSFFRYDHCKNPILDEQRTRRIARKVCEEGVGWDDESCLVLFVCANGALARPLSPSSLSGCPESLLLPNAFFSAAMKRVGSGTGSRSVIQAQCYFLSGVFLMSTLQPFDAWRMFLQSLAICQRFLRNQKTESFMGHGTVPNGDAVESIYWSSWKSEREVRLELHLPDFADMGLDAPRSFPNYSETDDGDNLRAWYFYLSEISLWRLETTAKKEMKALALQNPMQLYSALAVLAEEKIEQITAWQDSLPPSLSISEDGLGSEDTDILKFVLRGRTTYFHELISWPFIHAVVNDGVDIPLVRSWAARGFAFHLERLKINLPGFYYRHHGTWLMLQSSARSACILLLAAQVPSTIELLPQGWQVVVEATIAMLRFWYAQSGELGAIVDFLSLI